MTAPLALFYVFSTIIILSALRMITTHNPVHAVLFLVLIFFSSMGLWLMLEAEFLAIVLLLVYVGAVMVFFLFVIMMLDFNGEKKRLGFWGYAPWALLIGIIMAIDLSFILSGVPSLRAHVSSFAINTSNTHTLGLQLYTHYFLPFELAGILLVLAMVATITLTLHPKKSAPRRSNNPAQQINVMRKNRIRLVDLRTQKPSEKTRTK